jgi:enediyne biosynthesis protein E4
VSNTDWSWAALFADYDNDGRKDLFVTNGYLRDYTNLDFIKYMDDVVREKGRLKRQDVVEMITHMPSSNVNNYIFCNTGGVSFENKTSEWGMKAPSNSNGAAYADLDNDGDVDLVVNNINQEAFIFENTSNRNGFLKVVLKGKDGNTQGIGSKVTLWSKGMKQYLQQMPSRGYLSAVSPVLHFGLGNVRTVDSVLVQWPSGMAQLVTSVTPNTELVVSEEAASRHVTPNEKVKPLFSEQKSPIEFRHVSEDVNDFKRQPQLVTQLSHTLPVMIKGDVNGDGAEDIFVSGSDDQPGQLFIQLSKGSFVPKTTQALIKDSAFRDVAAAFIDVENDGDLDLYISSGGYHSLAVNDPLFQDRLYINDGKGNFSRSVMALPEMKVAKGCVAVSDFNGDGFADIFVGGRSVAGRYPETPESFLLVNDGKGKFENKTAERAPTLRMTGMVTSAVWSDMNGDGFQDLVVAGEWMPVKVFVNDGKNLKDGTDKFFRKSYSGWWSALAVYDFNADGKMDILAGNFGLNSQYQCSDDEPIEMFYHDFDKNGSVDPIICTYIEGKSYPYLTRDEMLEQLGFLRAQFTNYKDYSTATLDKVLKKGAIESAGHLSATQLRTSLFLSGQDGFLSESRLPDEAQFTCVSATVIEDFDEDGIADVILFGNSNAMKLKIGKLDAGYGTFLKGDGRGEFSYVPQLHSGLKVKGNVGSVVRVGDRLIVARSGETIQTYTCKQSENTLSKNQIAHIK